MAPISSKRKLLGLQPVSVPEIYTNIAWVSVFIRAKNSLTDLIIEVVLTFTEYSTSIPMVYIISGINWNSVPLSIS